MLTRARDLLAQLRRDERGIALPTAMLITVIGLGLAAVPIMASVNTQKGDQRDQASDAALAAANAGLSIAIQRQTKVGGSSATEACVYASGSTLLKKAAAASTSGSEVSGWCPTQTIASSSALAPAGAEIKYRVQPITYTATNKVVNIVVEGRVTTGGKVITRRVKTTASSSSSGGGSAPQVFSFGQIVGIDSFVIGNDAKIYNGGAGSNGTVRLDTDGNVCGSVRYGTSYSTDNSAGSSVAPPTWWPCTAGRTFTQGTASYPDFVLPTDIATNNSNSRLTGADPSRESSRGNISWNSSNKSLRVTYGTLTLGGTAPYYFCSIELAGGSSLKMASGAKIKMYFDPPEKCPALNGGPQLTFANGSTIYGDSANGPIIAMVGSDTANASRIELQGGAEAQQFVIYAPKSAIRAENNFQLTGAMVGKTMRFQGSAAANKKTFTPPDPSEFLPTTPATASAFSPSNFIECSAAASATTEPASGC